MSGSNGGGKQIKGKTGQTSKGGPVPSDTEKPNQSSPEHVRMETPNVTAPRRVPAEPPVVPTAAVVAPVSPVRRPHRFGLCRFLLRFTLGLLAFLFATGVLHNLAKSTNSTLWLATVPEKSTYEWMNATGFEEGGATSSVLKKMVFPRPVRGAKQLLVRVVKAAGNPVDYKMRQKPVFPLRVLPAGTGLDFSGYVVEADEGSRFKPGQRVFGMLPTVSYSWGTFADYVVNDEDFTAPVPEGVSYSEAAAAPLAALTALQALAQLGPVVENRTILIHAGSGGVGSFVIQIAKKIMKLKVFTTSSNVDLCKSLGADVVINYKTQKFEDFGPFDYVIDLIGGEYFLRGLSKTKRQYVSILNNGWEDFAGFAEAIVVGEIASSLIVNTLHYVTFGRYPKYTLTLVKTDGKALEKLGEWIKEGFIRVLLDEEFSGLEVGARKVHDRIQSGRAKGKVTLSIE